MAGLGAWRVDGGVKMSSELLRSHTGELREWSRNLKWLDAVVVRPASLCLLEAAFDLFPDGYLRTVCVGSLQESQAQIFPHIPETSDLVTLEPHNVTDSLKKLLGK
jgi:hypothetical protein